MLRSRLPSIFLVVAALMSAGTEFAVARNAPANDFSPLLEWKNQIIAELEHNKRYLPATRTRGKFGIVKFELNITHSGWVLPGTRIVTADPELGRVALLLLQQAQPFPPPDHVNLPDAAFRIVVPIRFNDVPAQDAAGLAAGLQDPESRKQLECYEADRQELEYQRRKAAYRKAEPPNAVYRMPEGCLEAKRQEAERQRQTEQEETEGRAAQACQGQEPKPMGQTLGQQPVGCEIAGLRAD
jgi:hypothetical protein